MQHTHVHSIRGSMQSKTFQHPHMQDWQQIPEMLNRSPCGSPSQQRAGPCPSPRRQLSSPGTDLESQGPSQDSPGVHAPLDQPAGIDSDDNFEVDDDADEQQVDSLLCTCGLSAVYLLCTCRVPAVHLLCNCCVPAFYSAATRHCIRPGTVLACKDDASSSTPWC